jgi:hypothetical protein
LPNDEASGRSSFVIRKFVIPLLFRLDDRSAAVVATVRADDVRRLRRAALGAGLKLLRLERVVRPPHAGAGIRLFAFGDTHDGHLSNAWFRGVLNPPAYAEPVTAVKGVMRAEKRRFVRHPAVFATTSDAESCRNQPVFDVAANPNRWKWGFIPDLLG